MIRPGPVLAEEQADDEGYQSSGPELDESDLDALEDMVKKGQVDPSEI